MTTTAFKWAQRRYLSLAMFVLALSGCASAATTPSTEPQLPIASPSPSPKAQEGLLALAEDAARAGNCDGAFGRFAQVLQTDPENGRALIGTGDCFLRSRNLDKALAAFERAEAQQAYRAQALQGQGIVLVLMGDAQGAQEHLKAAVARDPGMHWAWTALARYHDQRQEWDEARESYERALAAAPQEAAIRNNFGMSLFMQGQHESAAAAFRQALAMDPGLTVARENLRLALAWQGRYLEALSGTVEATRPVALNNIGYVAMLQGRFAEAEAYFLQAMQESPAYYETAAKNLEALWFARKIAEATGDREGTPQ